MGNKLSSLLKTSEMNPGAKGILLVIGAYVGTIGIAITIIALAVIVLLITSAGCGTFSWAIRVLFITIAAIFLTSVFVVRGVVRKITSDGFGRLAMVGTYGLAMLASYVVIAFGLLVLFNC